MNKTQWFVLGGIFLFGTYLFGNYYAGIWATSGLWEERVAIYEGIGSFSLLLCIASFIMGFLESKQKQKN